LDAYENMGKSLRQRLVPGGFALLELHDKGYDKVRLLYEKLGFSKITPLKDLRGFNRILTLIN